MENQSQITADQIKVIAANINHEKLESVNTVLVLRAGHEYYGEFNLGVSFHEAANIPTAGVNFKIAGPQFYYNRKFIDGLTDEETAFLLIHEDSHLLWNHPKRTARIEKVDFKCANIVQDMIINSLIRLHFSFTGSIVAPIKDAFFVPDEYKGDWIFEKLYDFIKQKQDERKEDQKGAGSPDDKQGENGEGQGNPKESDGGKAKEGDPTMKDVLDALDQEGRAPGQIDEHILDEIPEEYREKVVEEIKERLKARGLEKGAAEKMIDALTKPRHDYLKDVKRYVSQMKGGLKDRTLSRPNRRGFEGIKGTKQVGVALNAIVDTSGSMYGYLEKCIGVLMQDGIEINLIQCDTMVHEVRKIGSVAEFKKFRVMGGGGTYIQPAVERIKSDLNVKLPLVIITDGYTDNINIEGACSRCLVLTVDREMPVTGRNVKQVTIKDY